MFTLVDIFYKLFEEETLQADIRNSVVFFRYSDSLKSAFKIFKIMCISAYLVNFCILLSNQIFQNERNFNEHLAQSHYLIYHL